MNEKINYDDYDVETLARWVHEFNCWIYPDDFPISAPDGWDEIPLWNTKETNYPVTKESFPYHDEISSKIGRKECLRYHHVNNVGVKDWQFEVWWFLNGDDVSNVFENRYFDIYSILKWRKNWP